MRRKISLLTTLTFVLLLALQNYGCSGSGADVVEPDDAYHPDLNDPKLKERLGEDDGYSFAVMYGADIHGSLETCG